MTDPNRRTFLKAGGAVALVSGVPAAATEQLALSGGPRSVTIPAERAKALSRWPRYGNAEKQALARMIDSGQFYEELPLFEKEWRDYTNSPFVKAHMNGSSALTSMFFALDLAPGSEIMVPSYTFFSTCLPMRFFGYVPVFVDIDPMTACFDLEDAKRKLTPQTKAVVTMHSWGLPCEMDRIAEWCREKGLILLEDAAHAHGAEMQGKKMGTWGAIGNLQLPVLEAAARHRRRHGNVSDPRTTTNGPRPSAITTPPLSFPADSPVRAYEGTGLRAEIPDASVRGSRASPPVARARRAECGGHAQRPRAQRSPRPASGADENRSAALTRNASTTGQTCCYWTNERAGFTRDSLVKALLAEGVQASVWDYPEQHKLKIYGEAKWWHHPPVIPAHMPGDERVNHTHLFLPLLYGDAIRAVRSVRFRVRENLGPSIRADDALIKCANPPVAAPERGPRSLDVHSLRGQQPHGSEQAGGNQGVPLLPEPPAREREASRSGWACRH